MSVRNPIDVIDSFLDKQARRLVRLFIPKPKVSVDLQEFDDILPNSRPLPVRSGRALQFYGQPSEDLPEPKYYVQTFPGGFAVADPQPSTHLAPPVTDWSGMRADHLKTEVLVKQLEFLLDQAPMLDCPQTRDRCEYAVTTYAYIHPDTLYAIVGNSVPLAQGVRIGRSPTKWINTPLMPKYRVIFTPNLMPGMQDKI